jgi:putative DNA primase/helicase
VTYVMLEGELGLRNRLAAWQHRHQRPIPETFRAIIQPFNLGLEQDVADLCAALPEGGVVVIDTLNRAGPGLDENSSKDMGLIIAALKTIARKTGGLVIVVHHTGKDASKGMRGHSALNAALDAAIEVKSVDLRRCWTSAKVKDGPDDGIEPFRLETIPLGLDADGDPITSCVAIYDQNTPPIVQFRQPSGSQQRIVLDAIRVAIAEPADSDRATANGEASRIRFEDAISAAAMNLTSVAPAKRNHNARQLVEKLINRGFLQSAADRQGANWISISPRSS